MVEHRENDPGSSGEPVDPTTRMLAGLAATTPRSDDHLAQRAVSQVTARYRRRRTGKRLVALAVAAAVVGLVVVSVFQLTAHPGKPAGEDGPAPDAVVVAGTVFTDGAPVESGARIADGSVVWTEDDTARVEIGEGLMLGLAGQTRATVDEAGALRLALTLAKGRVELDVPTGRHWRVSVATERGLVEVVGTLFSVEQDDERLRVEVLRGTVAVTAPGSPTVTIGAGETLELPAPAEAAPAEPREQETTSPDSVKTPKTATKKKEPALEPPSPGELIRQARVCRTSGDWHCAAERYRQVRADYPGRPEAATALVALAGIELDQLGRPAVALEHYRRYLGRGGKGALAVEARYGVCRALEALGRKNEERRALRDFVAKHPSGVYASAASKRLEELGP